jgi:hypothetical protein
MKRPGDEWNGEPTFTPAIPDLSRMYFGSLLTTHYPVTVGIQHGEDKPTFLLPF